MKSIKRKDYQCKNGLVVFFFFLYRSTGQLLLVCTVYIQYIVYLQTQCAYFGSVSCLGTVVIFCGTNGVHQFHRVIIIFSEASLRLIWYIKASSFGYQWDIIWGSFGYQWGSHLVFTGLPLGTICMYWGTIWVYWRFIWANWGIIKVYWVKKMHRL